jgi:hypothetical protein
MDPGCQITHVAPEFRSWSTPLFMPTKAFPALPMFVKKLCEGRAPPSPVAMRGRLHNNEKILSWKSNV